MVSPEHWVTFSFFWFLAVRSHHETRSLTVVKIAGDTLLFEIYSGDSTSIEVATWGLILSQLGFYPLLNATFSFISKWFNPPKVTLTVGFARGNNRIQN